MKNVVQINYPLLKISQVNLIIATEKQQKHNKIQLRQLVKRKKIKKLIFLLSKLSKFILLIHVLILLNYFEGIVASFLFEHKTPRSSVSASNENNGKNFI